MATAQQTKVTPKPDYAGGVYVLDHGEFVTCMGFDVVMRKATALAKELGGNNLWLAPADSERGTMGAYDKYQALVELIRHKNKTTGYRSRVDLTPELLGLEGKRVEVVDCYGERRRFIVGKSTGWIPCHLEIRTRRSTGGEAVYGTPFKQVRVLNH